MRQRNSQRGLLSTNSAFSLSLSACTRKSRALLSRFFSSGCAPASLSGSSKRSLRMTMRPRLRNRSARSWKMRLRLISSARSRFVKIGPGRNVNLRRPVSGSSWDDVGAGDVARHEVGRELDAFEAEREHAAERVHQHRFGEAGDAHKQAVAAGKERDEQFLDHVVMADDDLGQFVADEVEGLFETLDGGNVVGRRGRGSLALARSNYANGSLASITSTSTLQAWRNRQRGW